MSNNIALSFVIDRLEQASPFAFSTLEILNIGTYPNRRITTNTGCYNLGIPRVSMNEVETVIKEYLEKISARVSGLHVSDLASIHRYIISTKL